MFDDLAPVVVIATGGSENRALHMFVAVIVMLCSALKSLSRLEHSKFHSFNFSGFRVLGVTNDNLYLESGNVTDDCN